MSATIPISLLVMARKKADLSQTQLATALQVAASVVSRLEATEQADVQMAKRYLSAINSEFGGQILEFFNQKWRCIERPPFMHPNRDTLWASEQAMQALDRFQESPQFDVILQDPLSRLKSRILTEISFIYHMEHGIAFIGEIGVGKTTALSFVTNLVMEEKSGELKSVFPTGSGRTTVCEVAIKIAPTFGIAVDSLAEEDVRALVADLVRSLQTGHGGLPSELERVIRSMSDLRRIPSRAKEKVKAIDHLKDMVEASDDVDQVVAEVISRMKLDTRTEAQMILSESAEGSIEWLATNIAKINYGQHPSFSVPTRITVLMPLNALRETPYRLSVIDTKGVEGTTQRPDLKAQIDDPRTVTVLCSKFADAPGNAPLSILREVIDAGSDAVDSERLCLLVLPRDDEALKIIDDTGSNPSSAEEGYAVREAQIDQQFATEGLPTIPMNFFNVGKDRPEDVWTWLTSMIEKIRANKVAKIHRLVQASQDLIANCDVAKTRQARLTIAETMEQAADRFASLPGIKRHAHLNLVEQAKKTHQSSIAASINRRGKWDNFPIAHILGIGVQKDANLRTRDSFIRLDEQIEGLKTKYSHLHDIKEFLESVQDEMAELKQTFLKRAALIGRVSYSPYLEQADGLWTDCSNRYGVGTGYRVDVSDIFFTHFEGDSEAQNANDKVQSSLQKFWQDLVITSLRQAIGYQVEQVD